MSLGKIGPYELLELLGEGGVGQVYRARDTILGRQVAIKMLRPELSRNREFITRFYNEAQRLANLSHNNITTLYALYLEGDKPFMVMELVRGRTLEELLQRTRRLPPRESLAVLAQAVAGLAYAHRAGVIHRDIKPPNLMLTNGGVVKIMDFGIARVRGSQRMTRAGQAFLTPLYASPEQIRGGEVDERSDLYSLGIVSYEMLAGRPPFTGETDHALNMAHLEMPPPPLAGRVPGLDPQSEAAVMRALAKRPEDRFATVEEFGRVVGATALRGDAVDILQEFVAATFRDAPPRTRQVRVVSEPRARPGTGEQRQRDESGSIPLRPRKTLFRLGQMPRSMRVPAAMLAAVAVVLLLGIGYVVVRSAGPAVSMRTAMREPGRIEMPAPSPPAQKTAVFVPPKPAPPSPLLPPPPPARTPAVLPVPTPAPSPTPVIVPAPAPAPSVLPPAPTPVIVPAPNPTPPILPPAPAPSPIPVVVPAPVFQPPPVPALPPPVPAMVRPDALPPQPNPDIEGVVSGAMSASLIKVGARWVELYGISDPTHNLPRHLQALQGNLAGARGQVECYRRPRNTFQCYSGGKDLALLALSQGIARPAPDAPSEYRAAVLRRHRM
ncbi:MAG TPA: serine/threonine-protein kinase [Stellaceae bacterium]|nr:serine/threonine-protein kinase [Stellaceae bacterium]